MSYAESQKEFCRFVAGHYVVMTRAWKKGERGFNVLWDITRARYIGRKLLVINVHEHALEVQPVNGREPFLVPWFVLEEFQQFQPVATPPIANNDEPKKDVVESKSVFAGFWRDGAVVKPEAKHWSACKCIFAIQKHDNSLDICLCKFDEWETVYWLDTTTPTELTPQEAFELLRVVYPQLHRIRDEGDGFAMMEGSPLNACIKWNGETQYPPRERWRVPTDADKGKRCRVKDGENEDWYESRFLVIDGKRFLARRDEDSYAYPYDFCEVSDNESN